MFLAAFVLCILRLFKLKTEGQTIYRKPLTQPGLASSGFKQPNPGAPI